MIFVPVASRGANLVTDACRGARAPTTTIAVVLATCVPAGISPGLAVAAGVVWRAGILHDSVATARPALRVDTRSLICVEIITEPAKRMAGAA